MRIYTFIVHICSFLFRRKKHLKFVFVTKGHELRSSGVQELAPFGCRKVAGVVGFLEVYYLPTVDGSEILHQLIW